MGLSSAVLGMVSQELRVIGSVWKWGGAASLYDIVIDTGLSPSTVLYVLRKLEEKRVVRVNDTMVALTEQGQAVIDYLRNLFCR